MFLTERVVARLEKSSRWTTLKARRIAGHVDRVSAYDNVAAYFVTVTDNWCHVGGLEGDKVNYGIPALLKHTGQRFCLAAVAAHVTN